MSTVIADTRQALRGLSRTPGFTAVVLLTLAIGTGATTAIFSVVNQVMLRPLTMRQPDRLMMLWESNQQRGWHQVQVAPANAMDWSEQVSAFEAVALADDNTRNVSLSAGRGVVTAAEVSRVSGNAFRVFGVNAALGRVFADEEWGAAAPPLVVLSHGAWMRHFGGDRTAIGRVIQLDGHPYEVIGVLPASFEYPVSKAELWTTYRWNAGWRSERWFRQAHVIRAIARLRPGATPELAASQLATVASRLESAWPETNRGMTAGLTPLHRYLVGDRRGALMLLLGAVALLQIIVCVNVANIMLSRAQARRQEMAVRSALGAGYGRIARQVLTESAVLAALGTALGLLVAAYGLDVISAMRPAELPPLVLRLDWRLLSFTAAVGAGSALLFGLQPAMASAGVDIKRQLGAGSRTSAGRSAMLASHGLAAVQVALAVVLVAGASLMVRSIANLRRVDAGVNTANVMTFEIAPPSGRYASDSAKADFAQRLIERLRQMPGVQEVGVSRSLPFLGLGWSGDFTMEDWPADRFGVEIRHREATPGYFRALQVPLLSGSLFAERPAPGREPEVVINQAFAERYFAGESPVGRRMAFDRVPDSTTTWYRVTGVVGNERMVLTADAAPEVIAHIAADTPSRMRFVVKAAAGSHVPVSIRAAVRELDAEIPVLALRSLDDVALEALSADRYVLVLFGVFAIVALVLSATGVYGVTAQAVRLRTREIGVRMAFGASGTQIVATLARRGLVFSAAGAFAGLLIALAASGSVRRLLFQVEPSDPIALGAAIALLLAVAAVAILVPARRAARLDPARVLDG